MLPITKVLISPVNPVFVPFRSFSAVLVKLPVAGYEAKKAPMIFEDGHQKRDFVHAEDVARAYLMALESDKANGLALNLGSGDAISVLEIAQTLAQTLGKEIAPIITGKYRDGDIRHCFADISLIQETLDWKPEYTFKNGVHTLLKWLLEQGEVEINKDSFAELREMGLLK